MEKKERTISVFATFDNRTAVQVTMTEDVDDRTNLINKAIDKIKQLERKTKNLKQYT